MTEFQSRMETAARIAEAVYGLTVEWQPIPGEVEVVQATLAGREELPIYLTHSGEQIICICYLWHDKEVLAERRVALLEALLDLNIPMPLSSFARVEGWFVVYGALSRQSRAEELAQELATLSENAVDALDAFAEYLK
ncbi:DUF2170 family protein [Chitinimonas viridis]|uniref:DUF2170 family protein n=1 Tax=Chitinimonas viridis TaxID=664880 RepID=A0ABT8B552_9NEIS|nr:DUF2170 family protein [Chitinimonas viridis]MBL8507924.1 DUF2170 family protein [Chitinimonas sp.]MDN3576766.1 DUF2170 family protein [Chitinimonas viridis]